jgi:hypothetical protein
MTDMIDPTARLGLLSGVVPEPEHPHPAVPPDRGTGSPQMGGFVGNVSQRIGNRLDLATLIASISGSV